MLNYKFEGSKVIINVDGDKDGIPVVSLTIDLAELPSEILAAIKK